MDSELDTTKNGMAIKIGVMGSASGPTSEDPVGLERSREVGRWIAHHGCITLTGACPGLPHAAAHGAKAEGGFVIGISPAFSHTEHTRDYRSPDDVFSMILYSAMGFMERDIVNIRAADGLIFLGGGIGTLNELTVAYEEHKPIGILEGIGGIGAHFTEILDWCGRPIRENIIFDAEPHKLVERLIRAVHEHPTFDTEDGRVTEIKFGKLRG